MRWVRTAVLALIITAIAIASTTHATAWVFWFPTQDNSPSSGASVTFGPYWDGVSLNWLGGWYRFIGSLPIFSTCTAPGVDISIYNPSFQTEWVGLNATGLLNGYAYSGVVNSYAEVSFGSTYTFSKPANMFVGFVGLYASPDYCGQLYFWAQVYNNSTSTAKLNIVYLLVNATYAFVTFYSTTVSPNTWFNSSVPGPNICISNPQYAMSPYIYAVVIYSNVSLYTVGTAMVSQSSTSLSAPNIVEKYPNVGFSTGDTVVVPWTTHANPYFVLLFTQTSVNTGGWATPGSFTVTVGPAECNYYPVFSFNSVEYILYWSDNDTDTFPTVPVIPINCPPGVIDLPTTASSSVSRILSCQSLTPPSNGVAYYPGDYSKYTSSVSTYSLPAYTVVNVSYVDSAGRTYAYPDLLTNGGGVYIYINQFTWSTQGINPNGVGNYELFAFQPTNPWFMSYVGTNYRYYYEFGYYLQPTQQCTLYDPYVSGTVTTALPGCVAIAYGAVSIVMWFYQPPNGWGPLIGVPNTADPIIYVWNGYLRGDYEFYGLWNINVPVSTGWHMLVIEEWYNQNTGDVNTTVYLDGQLVLASSANPGTIFSSGNNYGTYYFGAGFRSYGSLFMFYNGSIAWVAVYNTVLTQSQVQQLLQVGFPNALFSNNLVVAYLLSNNTYYYITDGISHNYIKPYYANPSLLNNAGLPSNATLSIFTPSNFIPASGSSIANQYYWVPFTMWQPVANYSVISYCRLMRYYTFNYLGGGEYQVVLVTNTNMNQFPLKYRFLITSGSGSQSVLPVSAYGNTNTFTNTTSATPTASAFLPVCDASPTAVATAIETTAVTPVCITNNIGYTATYTEKLPNGTTYTYTLTYILGTNASDLPPALVPTPIQAYPYALMLTVLIIIAIALYKFGDLGMRNSLLLAGATAVVTTLAYLGVGNPYVSFNLSCPNTYAPVTVTVPLPQTLFLATTWLGIIAIILVIASLITEYALY